MTDRTSLSKWLLAGTPSVVILGVVSVVVLHAGFKIPWRAATVAVAVQLGIQVALYIVMYWVRERFQRTHDLRATVVAFGMYGLIAGLIGMRYAEQLGIVSSGVFSANCVPFSIFMAIVTAMSFILFTFWKLE